MSLSEIVVTLSKLYYGYLDNSLNYSLLISRLRESAKKASLELNVNTLYNELSEIGTKNIIQSYIHSESERKSSSVNVKEAWNYCRDVLHYTEFFLKYEQLLVRISDKIALSNFEAIFSGNFCLDDAISNYNSLITGIALPELRPYLISPRQSIGSIQDRANKVEVSVKEHNNKYSGKRLAALSYLL